jgi:thiol:disulfide interchange protein
MKSLYLLLFLSFGLASQAQENGIRFTNDTLLSTLLEKAMNARKLVFINCYDTICGACKLMDKQVYSDKEVGIFFNKNFINAKFDMLSPERLKLLKAYNINALPTFLFVNSKGELVMKAIGYLDSKNFIKIGQTALNPKLF